MDFWMGGEYHYMPSPILIGVFEFTMMRTDSHKDPRRLARLFHRYMEEDGTFFTENARNARRTAGIRTLPHEESIGAYVEVMDYERALSIVEATQRIAIGICSCRHEKHHVGKKGCDTELETCVSFDAGADFLIRRNMAREISKSEMKESLSASREQGLVFNVDNVRKGVLFLCQCCSCCCNVLMGLNKFGYPNTLVTSSYIAEVSPSVCRSCGSCVDACPVDAIRKDSDRRPLLNSDFCIGCGVCALGCPTGAIRLMKRTQRVLHPETTFEKIILQCLEQGTLQNFIFDNPQSIGHRFMRGFLGGFLKLSPVKRALMSDVLRSTFLSVARKTSPMPLPPWDAFPE